MKSKFFIRNLYAASLVESFLIAAVATILGIRLFLAATGYPSLGGAYLHIAHMLWGGLLMMAALILLLSFLDEPLKNLSAVIGGVGFGAFIDELGKFITRDNNYFFQPTIALLYVLFVLLYFMLRYLQRYTRVTEEEYVANALELLKESVTNSLSEEERERAMELLSKAPAGNRLAGQLLMLLQDMPVAVRPAGGWRIAWNAGKNWLHARYIWLISRSWFFDTVASLFVFASFYFLITALVAVYELYPEFSPLSLLRIASACVSLYFALKGIFHIRSSRLLAFRSFERALLVSLFLTQFLSFYVDQLSAITELLLSVLTLYVVRYAIREESKSSTEFLPEGSAIR